jgi:hypothetical protein
MEERQDGKHGDRHKDIQERCGLRTRSTSLRT